MNAVPLQTRRIMATVGGIAVGVLLIATAWAPAQLLGALGVFGGLAIARGGGAFVDAWLSDPVQAATSAWARGQQATPAWAWPATVAGLVALAAMVLVVELLTANTINARTVGNLGKGAIAVAMMGSLFFWSSGGTAWLARRRRPKSPHRPALK